MRSNCHLSLESQEPERSANLAAKMGYLSLRDDEVRLTNRGRELFETSDRALVLRYMLEECVGMYDILAAVRRLGSADAETAFKQLQAEFPSWHTKGQYRARLNWLESLGAVNGGPGARRLTAEGKRILSEYEAQNHVTSGQRDSDELGELKSELGHVRQPL
jgi:hypothetical protein